MIKIKAQTVFAFMFYGTLCYMIVAEKSVPDSLIVIVSTISGFYYGKKGGILNKTK